VVSRPDLRAIGESARAQVTDRSASWRERARCAETDPEAFFLDAATPREATRICAGCDVRTECLEYALIHDERFGIWGGLTEAERRGLRHRTG
jgi:WhiB family redox-sensing transcriptional regulator